MSDLEEKLQSGKKVYLIVKNTTGDFREIRMLTNHRIRLHYNRDLGLWISYGLYDLKDPRYVKIANDTKDLVNDHNKKYNKNLEVKLLYEGEFEKLRKSKIK